jgi:hypothetical protein
MVTASVRAECDALSVECIQKHVVCLTATPFALKSFSLSDVQFDDDIIQQCADAIEQTKTFKPLQQTWEFIKNNDVDEVVLGKFSLLLVLSYHTIFSQIAQKNRVTRNNRVTFFSIIPLYYQLSKIPLNKLFDSLEECWNQYQAIMENYAPEKDESFSSWVQNNWWVPVFVSVFTVISFFQWYRAHAKVKNIF